MPRRPFLALLGACVIVPMLAGCNSNPEAPTAPKPGDPDTSPPATKASKGSTAKGVEPVPVN